MWYIRIIYAFILPLIPNVPNIWVGFQNPALLFTSPIQMASRVLIHCLQSSKPPSTSFNTNRLMNNHSCTERLQNGCIRGYNKTKVTPAGFYVGVLWTSLRKEWSCKVRFLVSSVCSHSMPHVGHVGAYGENWSPSPQVWNCAATFPVPNLQTCR